MGFLIWLAGLIGAAVGRAGMVTACGVCFLVQVGSFGVWRSPGRLLALAIAWATVAALGNLSMGRRMALMSGLLTISGVLLTGALPTTTGALTTASGVFDALMGRQVRHSLSSASTGDPARETRCDSLAHPPSFFVSDHEGRPVAQYTWARNQSGRVECFLRTDPPGFHPLSREPLRDVTPEIVAEILAQGVPQASNPSPAGPAAPRQAVACAPGNHPEAFFSTDVNGRRVALFTWSQNPEGGIDCFVRTEPAGVHPLTAMPLLDVTPEVVSLILAPAEDSPYPSEADGAGDMPTAAPAAATTLAGYEASVGHGHGYNSSQKPQGQAPLAEAVAGEGDEMADPAAQAWGHDPQPNPEDMESEPTGALLASGTRVAVKTTETVRLEVGGRAWPRSIAARVERERQDGGSLTIQGPAPAVMTVQGIYAEGPSWIVRMNLVAVQVGDQTLVVESSAADLNLRPKGRGNAAKTVGSAVLGGLVGGLLGGRRGLVIGLAGGGTAGYETAKAGADAVEVKAGTRITFVLTKALRLPPSTSR